MRWLLENLMTLMRARTREKNQREDLYASGGNRQTIMRSLAEDGDSRKRVVHAIGPRASTDGLGWESEYFTYVDDNSVQMVVDYRLTRRCDCGALIGYNDVSLLGICGVCSGTVCTNEGCSSRCERCGTIVCARHAVKISKHTFCQWHGLYGRWLQFWGCLQ